MKPNGGGSPSGQVAQAIDRDCGESRQVQGAIQSGRRRPVRQRLGWLVAEGGKLKIMATSNAVNPLAEGQTALLTCDVWEHAYYLDYQNRRPDFVQTFLDHLINWDFVAQNLAKAR